MDSHENPLTQNLNLAWNIRFIVTIFRDNFTQIEVVTLRSDNRDQIDHDQQTDQPQRGSEYLQAVFKTQHKTIQQGKPDCTHPHHRNLQTPQTLLR